MELFEVPTAPAGTAATVRALAKRSATVAANLNAVAGPKGDFITATFF
jgi:hypothetical protein